MVDLAAERARRARASAPSPSSSPAPPSSRPKADAPTTSPASSSSPRRPRAPSSAKHRRWWTHPLTGRQVVIRAATTGELEARVQRLEVMRRDLKDGTITPSEMERTLRRLTHGAVLLERAALAYSRREGLSPETARHARSWIASTARELAGVELDALNIKACQQWIDGLRARGGAASSLGTAWRMLRAVHAYAAARGWSDPSPPWGAWRPLIRGKRAVREREAARSPEELAELLRAAAALDAGDVAASRLRLANLEARIAAVGLLGMRQGELAGLRWRDVDAAAGTVTIARQWDRRRLPKGRRIATLRALPELFALFAHVRARLEALGLLSAGGDGPVFPEPAAAAEGRRMHTASGSRPRPLSTRELQAAVRRAGLPHPERWTATSLRDTFALLEAEAYAGDLRGLSERTRHASLASLVRYLQSRSRAPAAPGFRLPPGPSSPPALPPAGPRP